MIEDLLSSVLSVLPLPVEHILLTDVWLGVFFALFLRFLPNFSDILRDGIRGESSDLLLLLVMFVFTAVGASLNLITDLSLVSRLIVVVPPFLLFLLALRENKEVRASTNPLHIVIPGAFLQGVVSPYYGPISVILPFLLFVKPYKKAVTLMYLGALPYYASLALSSTVWSVLYFAPALVTIALLYHLDEYMGSRGVKLFLGLLAILVTLL